MKVSEIGEFGLIERIEGRVGLASYPVIIGIGDDASVLDGDSAYDLVTTTDMLIEGIHFLRDGTPFHDLGYKSHTVNLSDVAAMGAIPVQSFLSFALPGDADVESVEAFLDGFMEAGSDVQLCGGDTVSSPQGWAISVTVIGRAPSGRVLRRDTAMPGDSIWLSGPVGDSAAGLAILLGKVKAENDDDARYLISKHNRPIPCLKMGRILSELNLSRCAIDLSDGLLQDLSHICRRSGIGARLDIERIPLSSQIVRLAESSGQDAVKWALSGGEDYSLLFTVKPADEERLARIVESEELDAGPIGKVVVEPGIKLTKHGKPYPFDAPGGFNHFKKGG
jgi:thiamine-monophosphate kinase